MNEICWNELGLSGVNGQRIIDILSAFGGVREAILFGSRAKGNYKPGSDIDIAVKGTVTKDVQAQLLTAFEESLLPYFVDIVVYDRLQNEELREHIDRVGVGIFSRIT